MPELNDLFPKIEMIKLTRVYLKCGLYEAKTLFEEFLENYDGGREKNSKDFKEILPRYIHFLTAVSHRIDTNILEFKDNYLQVKKLHFWEYAEKDDGLRNLVQFQN